MQTQRANFLRQIAQDFQKVKKQFTGIPSTKIYRYLKKDNQNSDPALALHAAYKHVTGKEANEKTRNKFKRFAVRLAKDYVSANAKYDLIPFMQELGREAEEKASNPEFADQHVILFGENHECVDMGNRDFSFPQFEWLGNNLDELKDAGYTSIAIEKTAPSKDYRSNYETWLGILYKIKDDLDAYLTRKCGPIRDYGAIEFFNKFERFLEARELEIEKERSFTLYPDEEKTHSISEAHNWLISKASRAGFDIIAADCSLKAYDNGFFPRYLNKYFIPQMQSQSQQLDLIKDYLLYKENRMHSLRDNKISKDIIAKLRENSGNIIGIFGSAHSSKQNYSTGKNTYNRLKEQGIAVANIRAEFKVPDQHKKTNSQEGDKGLLARFTKSNQNPIAMRSNDLVFFDKIIFAGEAKFRVNNGIFTSIQKNQQELGLNDDHDAVAVLPIPNEEDTCSFNPFKKLYARVDAAVAAINEDNYDEIMQKVDEAAEALTED